MKKALILLALPLALTFFGGCATTGARISATDQQNDLQQASHETYADQYRPAYEIVPQ